MKDKIVLHDKTFRPYIGHDRIMAAIDAVAAKVNADFAGCEDVPIVLCVLNGAIPFTGELLQRLDFNCELVSIKMSSYQGTRSTGTVLTMMGLTADVKGRRIIICEDIVDTGNTIVALKEMLLDKGAADVKICTMLFKSGVYAKPDKVDYIGMDIPNAFIVGFGLDYNELGRNTRDIYVIDENMKYYILFGPPGAGKGTHAGAIAEKYNLKHISTGELCSDYSGRLRGVGGLIWIPEYGRKFALQARWHDAAYKEYSGIALGWETFNMVCTADAAYRLDKRQAQYKTLVLLKPELKFGGFILAPKLRWSGRLRPSEEFPLRNDLRADLEGSWRGWTAAGRFNALWCENFGWLWYAQAGRKTNSFTLSLRGGIFRIDNWNDRIYVYQQDAPGNFNVPAFYGRGWNLSLYAAVHLGRHHSIWLRLDCVQYPWNLTPKQGRLECRLQYRWRS